MGYRILGVGKFITITVDDAKWLGEVKPGDASVFRVWGSRAFIHDTSADKLSARAIPCVFLGFSPDAPSWQFYHPTSRRVFPSQDVTFDESVPFYHLFPYRSAPPPPPPLFLAQGPPPVDPLPLQGPAPLSVSHVDPLPSTAPVEIAVGSGAAPSATSGGSESGGAEPGGAESEGAGSGGAEPGGAETGGAEPKGVEPGGAEPEGVEPGGAESEGAESGGAEPRGTASFGGPAGSSPRLSPRPEPLSPQQLREWFAQCTCLRNGAAGAGDSAAGDIGAGGAGVTARAGGTGGAAAVGLGGAHTRGTRATGTGGVGGAGAGDPTEPVAAGTGGAGSGGTSAGGAGAGGAGTLDPRAGGAGGTVRPRPYFPASPLPPPSPYTEQTGGLTEHREPASRHASPVRAGRCVPHPRPSPIPGTHVMAICPSFVPQRVPLPAPPKASLPAVPDPESDRAHAASYSVSRLLATIVTDPAFESTAASALVAELLEFAATMIHAAAPHFLWPFAVRLAMRRCSGSGDLVPLFAILLPPHLAPCRPSEDVTFDKSVPFYRLFPYRSAPSPPPPLFLAPGPPPVDPLPPQGPTPSGVSQVDPLPGTTPVLVVVVSGAAPGAASGGAASGGAELGGAGSEGAGSGGAEPEGVEPGGAESEGAEPEGAESEGAESGGTAPRGAASSGGRTGASPRLSSQQLREWLVQHAHRRSGAPGAGGPGGAGAGGATVPTGVGDPTEPGAVGTGGAGAGVAGVGGLGAGGARAAGAGAVDPGAGGAGGTVRSRPYFVPLLEQVLGVPSSTGLTERREPASRPVSPVCTARRVPHSRPPPVPGIHTMALRPSSVPLCVPLPAPPESSLPEVPDPESNRARVASPIVARLLATAVTDPSFESAAASALVAELLDFAAACRLDYASALVAESVPASPPSVGGECALGTDVLEDKQEDFESLAATVPRFTSLLLAPEGDPDAPDIPTPRSYAEAITGPYSSKWQAAMDAEMASWKSTGTYVDEVPPPGVNIVDGMWIFRTPSLVSNTTVPTAMASPTVLTFHAEGRAVDFDVWVDDLQWDSRDGVSLFDHTSGVSTAPAASADSTVHSQWTTRDTVARLAVRSHLPPTERAHFGHRKVHWDAAKRVLRYLCSTSSMWLVLGGRGSVVLTRHSDASWADNQVTQRSSQGYNFSLGSGSVSWRSTRSSFVLGSSCEAEIYAGAMVAQELRWLTYLLTDLGERPRSPPQCRQLRLSYVASRANTADVFTKALGSGDHQRFCTALGLRPSLSHTLVPVTPVLTPSASRARLSRALAPAAPASRRPCFPVPSCRPCCFVAPAVPSCRPCRRVTPAVPSRPIAPAISSRRPLLSRPVLSPLLSRPVAPAVALPLLSRPVPSPLLSRRIAPCFPVPSRCPCCPVPLSLLTRPIVLAVLSRRPPSVSPRRAVRSVPTASRFPSCPVARAPCAPAAPCPSVAPRAPCASLLLESEETHFTQVRTASDFLTAIKARYATPTTVSLGRLFLPFLFPDLALFERTAESITNLRSLDSSYRAACTDAQLVLLPPPMAITLYFIATSLPDRLASVRDALLLKHPSELTIEVLESALKDVERNLRSVASASGVVPPPLFHGCTVPQLPTFPAVRD
ncbi:unnamed protein product [Closterium sp. NIES-53]